MEGGCFPGPGDDGPGTVGGSSGRGGPSGPRASDRRAEPRPREDGESCTDLASDADLGSNTGLASGGCEAGRASDPDSGPGSSPLPSVPDADANRSSRESATAAGPVSSVESSYNCLHQSSS
jgi:hypothetical protein